MEKKIVAVMKEHTQSHNKSINKQNFKDEFKTKALDFITPVTQKTYEIIKGRAITNGRQQKSREYFDESRISTPTI